MSPLLTIILCQAIIKFVNLVGWPIVHIIRNPAPLSWRCVMYGIVYSHRQIIVLSAGSERMDLLLYIIITHLFLYIVRVHRGMAAVVYTLT